MNVAEERLPWLLCLPQQVAVTVPRLTLQVTFWWKVILSVWSAPVACRHSEPALSAGARAERGCAVQAGSSQPEAFRYQ